MNCSPPGSSVHGILQVRILEWVTFPPSEDLPDPGMEPKSPASLALASGFSTSEPPEKSRTNLCYSVGIHLLKKTLMLRENSQTSLIYDIIRSLKVCQVAPEDIHSMSPNLRSPLPLRMAQGTRRWGEHVGEGSKQERKAASLPWDQIRASAFWNGYSVDLPRNGGGGAGGEQDSKHQL